MSKMWIINERNTPVGNLKIETGVLVNEFWFSNLSSGVGVGLVVWYRTGGAVGGIGGAVR